MSITVVVYKINGDYFPSGCEKEVSCSKVMSLQVGVSLALPSSPLTCDEDVPDQVNTEIIQFPNGDKWWISYDGVNGFVNRCLAQVVNCCTDILIIEGNEPDLDKKNTIQQLENGVVVFVDSGGEFVVIKDAAGGFSFINVMDYGAVADGITNDSAAFAAALTAAGTTKTVVVPDGTYLINTTIVLQNQAMMGFGDKAVLTTTNITGAAFDGNSVFNVVHLKDNCKLSKINFSGTGRDASYVPTYTIQNAIRISGSKNVVDSCKITNMKGSGIFMFDEVFDSFYDNRITNISIDFCTVGYLNYYYGQFTIFSNSRIRDCRLGIIEYGNNNNMADVHVNWCDKAGIFNNSVGDDHGFVTGCSFTHSNEIEFKNLQHGYTLTGCQFWYCNVKVVESDKVILSNCSFGEMSFNISATITTKTTLVTGGYATSTVSYISSGTGVLQRVGIVTPNNPSYNIFGLVNIQNALEYADNAAAITGGLIIGNIYRTGDIVKIVH